MKSSSVLAILLWAFLLGQTDFVNCAKILGLFHFPSRSQHVLGSYLLKELAARGHEVTMLSPYPFEEPVANYTDIFVDNGLLTYLHARKDSDDVQDKVMVAGKEQSVIAKMMMVPKAFQDFGRLFLESPEVEALLQSKETKFDVIISLLNMNEAFLGFGHHFNAPVIPFCTTGASLLVNHLFGNPAPYAMVPSLFVPAVDSFWDRVKNTGVGVLFELLLQFWQLPTQEAFLKKHFPTAPPLQDLINDVHIGLLNSHPAIEGSLPYMPNMIPIGGFHSAEPAALTGNLQKFLDSAREGAILFSFGTNVKPSTLPKERLENMMRVLGGLRYKVIFKHDDEWANVPANMLITKWMPQTSVLAHKNMKLFITHAGLGGVAEAVMNSVPMICIPFFGDQHKNCHSVVKNGYGLRMIITELDDDTLKHKIDEILLNPTYKKKITATGDFYRSQPIKPLEKAIYWVEHVIKHKGAAHFPKSVGAGQPMYQYLLLDVLGFISAILLTITVVFYIIIKVLIKVVCKKFERCSLKSSKKSTENKKSKAAKSKKKN